MKKTMKIMKNSINNRCAVIVTLLIIFANPLLAAEDPNTFNRLFTPPDKAVVSLKDDGIHDPEGPAAAMLQEPKEAFKPFVKSVSGNFVDWGKTLKDGKIDPRFDHLDADKKPTPMNLNIVMEVKGTTPNVVFPHAAHTELLDCSNCHPELFVPQKGANQMSMAEIMLGKKCGLCHGSVAFPVTECKTCHSQQKSEVKPQAKSEQKPKK